MLVQHAARNIEIKISKPQKIRVSHGKSIPAYTLEIQPQASLGTWSNACSPDSRGVRKGFILKGAWDGYGKRVLQKGLFSVHCLSGAVGKCIRLGYSPETPIHAACTRMMRADYCGDGKSHTQDGTPVEFYDREGVIAKPPKHQLSFEAAWNENGAVCIYRPRFGGNNTLAAIEQECPGKFAGRTGKSCLEQFDEPIKLLLNRSNRGLRR